MSKTNKISHHLSTTSSPLILDGALATYLESLGADISGSLWSASILLSQPSLIKRTHLDYYRAGANIAITASYQASIPGLVKHLGLSEEEAKDVVRKSVELAKEAREEYANEQVEKETVEKSGSADAESEVKDVMRGKMYVAGSVGPYGAFLADGSEYRGDYVVSKADMKAFHRGRMQALADAGVDLLACETIPSRAEAEALVEMLREEFEGMEAWFTFTLRDGGHIADGTPLGEVAKLFEEVEQVIGLGVNCVPDDLALAALKGFAPFVQRGTLVVYPNSGEQWNAKAREWEGKRTEGSTLAHKTVEWWYAGARMIGGCCRTSPADVRTMCEALLDR